MWNEIVQAISSVGFPIVMCIYMVKSMKELNEAHKSEVDGLKEAINNNTIAITELRDKFNN